jgi:hypothetical protein
MQSEKCKTKTIQNEQEKLNVKRRKKRSEKGAQKLIWKVGKSSAKKRREEVAMKIYLERLLPLNSSWKDEPEVNGRQRSRSSSLGLLSEPTRLQGFKKQTTRLRVRWNASSNVVSLQRQSGLRTSFELME